MKPMTREAARRRGLRFYYTGKPCRRGHMAKRWTSNTNCVECLAASNRAWNAANPEKKAASNRAWRAAHPDHVPAQQGLTRARIKYPGCVPPEFDLKQTIPFYAEARRRTRETGVLHVVDHIVALCLGGQHVASNLQVLTEEENREKAKTERKRPRA
jgi:hypothetical protein